MSEALCVDLLVTGQPQAFVGKDHMQLKSIADRPFYAALTVQLAC